MSSVSSLGSRSPIAARAAASSGSNGGGGPIGVVVEPSGTDVVVNLATSVAGSRATGQALAMVFAATYPNVMAGPIVEPAPA